MGLYVVILVLSITTFKVTAKRLHVYFGCDNYFQGRRCGMLQIDPNLKGKIEQAKKRVVTTPRQALKWMLRFVNEIAIDGLPEKVWEKVQVEIAVFSFYFPQFQRGSCFLAINSRSFFESMARLNKQKSESSRHHAKH